MRPKLKQFALTAALAGCFATSVGYSLLRWNEAAQRGWSGLMLSTVIKVREGSYLKVEGAQLGSPASRAGFREGDLILEMNGIPAEELGDRRGRMRGMKPGQVVRHKVRRDGREFEIELQLANSTDQPTVIAEALLQLLTGLVFLTIGTFVYWQRPQDVRALLFFVTCSAFGLARMFAASPMRAHGPPARDNWFVGLLIVFLTFFVFPPLLHFCLIFPRRRPSLERNPAMLRWIYGVPAGSALLAAGMMTVGFALARGARSELYRTAEPVVRGVFETLAANKTLAFALLTGALAPACAIVWRKWAPVIREEGIRKGILLHPGRTLLAAILTPSAAAALAALVLTLAGASPEPAGVAIGVVLVGELIACLILQFLVFPFAACVSLYRSYREAGREEKQQIRWPLWGLMIGVGGYYLSGPLARMFRSLMWAHRDEWPFVIGGFLLRNLDVICLVLIPLSFAFAILKYRLMEITVYIRRTLIYGTLTGLLGLMYLLIVGGLGEIVRRWAGIESDSMLIAATLMVAAAFVPVRNRVQAFVDRRFFRRRYDYPATLQLLAREIAQSGDRPRLLSTAADRLQEALQNRSVLVCLRDTGERNYTPAAEVGLSDKLLESVRFSPDGALVKNLETIGRPDYEALAEGERRLVQAIGAALLVPIRRRGELLGFLSLGTKLSDEEYDEQDSQFLAAAADQVAIALDNLRFEEQQREFERARDIQQALLPKELPRTPGIDISAVWRPARMVGGDYYDVFEPGEGRVTFVIADVSGKGLTAALLMSNLQAAVRAFAPETPEPKELCGRVNRMICSNVTPGRFITCFYGVLDLRSGRLTFSNAGHNPPLLRRRDGSLLKLEKGGPVFGVIRQAQYEQDEVDLRAGDRLILFTDGVSEAFNAQEEEFGEQRLAQLLALPEPMSAAELQRMVLESVGEFCENQFHDDAALIAVTVGAAASEAARV